MKDEFVPRCINRTENLSRQRANWRSFQLKESKGTCGIDTVISTQALSEMQVNEEFLFLDKLEKQPVMARKIKILKIIEDVMMTELAFVDVFMIDNFSNVDKSALHST